MGMHAHSLDYDAIIVAGGAGRRMGGVSKADLVVDGSRLLDTVVGAVSDARQIVVVGDASVPDGVVLTREDPPGTGPAAGLGAGLAAVEQPSPWTMVLCVDLPDAARVASRLRHSCLQLDHRFDGVVLAADGRTQWLMACYRTDALMRAIEEFGNLEHAPLRRVLSPLRLAHTSPGDALPIDLDSHEDLARWEQLH